MVRQKKIITDKELSSIRSFLTTLAAALIVIIGLQYIAKDLIAPVLLSVFLSILMLPVFRWFRRRNFSRGVSIILMLGTFICTVAGLGIFLSRAFSLMQESLSDSLATFQSEVTQYLGSYSSEEVATTVATTTSSTLASLLVTIANQSGNVLFYLILTPILAVLLILEFDAIPPKAINSLTSKNPDIDRYKKFSESVMIYAVNRFKINLVTGLLLTVALFLLGVDFPVVWGILTALLSFVPYIGIVIAGIPPTLLALSESGTVTALLVIICIFAINLFAENILDPYIQGKGNKLSTATVVIAFIFWTWVLGALGAILAVPLTVLLKVILEDYKETHWMASLMGGIYEQPPKKSSRKSFLRFLPGT